MALSMNQKFARIKLYCIRSCRRTNYKGTNELNMANFHEPQGHKLRKRWSKLNCYNTYKHTNSPTGWND